jgi:ParB-like chromosome segregation protein Spo0J
MNASPATAGISMTETILELADPSRLPPTIQTLGEQLGPFLTAGLNYRQIAEELGRSEDWVADRVHLLRSALAANALEVAGDELDVELRARLEAFVGR